MPNMKTSVARWMSICLMCGASAAASAADRTPDDSKPASVKKAAAKPKIDRSGAPQTGKASYYAKKFHGKKMADGTPMNPNSNVAASRTLPLGTTAKVTNLENGKSEVVEIRDRGPFVPGRIVDVSPKVADKLDMKEEGIATVKVDPIELPPAK